MPTLETRAFEVMPLFRLGTNRDLNDIYGSAYVSHDRLANSGATWHYFTFVNCDMDEIPQAFQKMYLTQPPVDTIAIHLYRADVRDHAHKHCVSVQAKEGVTIGLMMEAYLKLLPSGQARKRDKISRLAGAFLMHGCQEKVLG